MLFKLSSSDLILKACSLLLSYTKGLLMVPYIPYIEPITLWHPGLKLQDQKRLLELRNHIVILNSFYY